MSDADLDDLSALDAQAPLGGEILGNDAQTLKQIRRRSSPITKVVGLVIVLGMVGMGIWAYLHNEAYDARMDVFAPIADMESAEQRDAALREVLANAEFKDVRERAIMNLGHDEDTAAVPPLIETLHYEGTVRRSAAWAPARIAAPHDDHAAPRLHSAHTHTIYDTQRYIFCLLPRLFRTSSFFTCTSLPMIRCR